MTEDRSEYERAAEEMREFEQADELPSDLSEWPSGKAKYMTIGDADDDAYGDGVTGKLGPADLVRHEDGSVTVAGEQVDPDEYRGEPIESEYDAIMGGVEGKEQ